jgi:lysophospholipase L1-like esterase
MANKKADIIGPGAILYPSEGGDPLTYANAARRFLAQGDSWFSIGAMPPFKTTNILMELDFPQSTCIVNCAYPGDTLAHMVNWRKAPQFVALVTGRTSVRWDAILLTAGGNDVVDAAAVPPVDKFGLPVPSEQRLLLAPSEWTNAPGVERYISQAGWNLFESHFAPQLVEMMKMIDSGRNAGVPVFMNLYDYPTPRNAPASKFPLKSGPWLQPALSAYKIPEADWPEVAKCLIDKLANLLKKEAKKHADLYLVDTRGVLTPAEPDTKNKKSDDWENEIHPSRVGYKKLSSHWEAAILAKVAYNLVSPLGTIPVAPAAVMPPPVTDGDQGLGVGEVPQ